MGIYKLSDELEREVRIERMRIDIFKYVMEYWTNFATPIRYAYIAQRWNRAAKSIGVDLREFVISDERLLFRPTKRGGYVVLPESAIPEQADQRLAFLNNHNLPII